MPGKPTFVLVPGAWHSAETWAKIVSLMETYQYKCVPISLPSTLSNPSATLSDDIKAVRDVIVAETTQGHDVVVVVHSYGGVVGSSAIKGLTRSKHDATSTTTKDSPGHVVGLLMMASGFVVAGLSFIDGFGGKPPPIWDADRETGFVVITVDPRELFYHDLPLEEGSYWVEKLQKQAMKPLYEGSEDTYEGWRDVPVWYLATTEDKALPVQAQIMFVQTAKDAGAEVTVREVNSSHSPMLSRPKETVDFMLEAVSSM